MGSASGFSGNAGSMAKAPTSPPTQRPVLATVLCAVSVCGVVSQGDREGTARSNMIPANNSSTGQDGESNKGKVLR